LSKPNLDLSFLEKEKETFDCTVKNRKTDLLSWVMIIYPANKIKIMVE
jgi:hypothetical protein